MARVKNAVNSHKKRRTVLERASGYRGQRSRLYRMAKQQMLHSLVYAFNDRKDKKGDFPQLWITRINAGARLNGMSYSQFMGLVNKSDLELNRKVLADLAMNHPEAFKAVVNTVKK